MIRDMTWNAFHKRNGKVLTWEDKAIDFNSKESAIAFLENHNIDPKGANIKHGILYYDGGHIREDEIKDGKLSQ